MKGSLKSGLALAPLLMAASAASAAGTTSEGITAKPLLEARLRFEQVDQVALDAEALTFRLRGGAEVRRGPVSILAQVEGTTALVDHYNAFAFPIGSRQRRPGFATIADPENLELDRFQLQYRGKGTSLTLGRQVIALDDNRWVGSGAWRQNQQTFDAIRGETQVGPVTADIAYAVAQRTTLGEKAGARTALDGHFLLAGVGTRLGPLQGKLFAYLLDYDEGFYLANSSKTLGAFVGGAMPLGGKAKLNLRASYARQSD